MTTRGAEMVRVGTDWLRLTAVRQGRMRVQFAPFGSMFFFEWPFGRPLEMFLIFSKDFFDQIAFVVMGCSFAMYSLCFIVFASIPRSSAIISNVYPVTGLILFAAMILSIEKKIKKSRKKENFIWQILAYQIDLT
jgi:hypothetical protein